MNWYGREGFSGLLTTKIIHEKTRAQGGSRDLPPPTHPPTYNTAKCTRRAKWPFIFETLTLIFGMVWQWYQNVHVFHFVRGPWIVPCVIQHNLVHVWTYSSFAKFHRFCLIFEVLSSWWTNVYHLHEYIIYYTREKWAHWTFHSA